ncbi:MAG: RIO1 family regulatory kinase/ATPase [Aggregatilineales bacterium]|nr:hypothetical protein [Chloroflexota bacterium]HOA22956.1 RIO1 family regulatory kinase/ATPase [Aggregatilineales bacterium]HPV06660.1 RIO1 family regulatory kinase/ATPase [Aggregatilineales bacterium]
MSRRYDAYEHYDKYEDYEEWFDPMRTDRKARRRRKPKANHAPKKRKEAIIEELADHLVELEGGFKPTYTPSRYEKAWLIASLQPFYEQAIITDVLALVKGGKEASVYRCAAHPSTGETLLAAKVYRPRMFRELRNDRLYREGRGVLDADGHDVTGGLHRDRIMRALGKKTEFGVQVAHTSWLMHEFTTLKTLHEAGASVPKPFLAAENAIAMSYHGDEAVAAPTLNTVTLEPQEARRVFDEVMHTVEIMLEHGLVHGDLSAYNVLLWQGKVTVIDFPQVVDVHRNPNAGALLHRDITRLCEYFARQGVERDADAIFGHLWRRYLRRNPEEVLADLSRAPGWSEG